MMKRAMAAATLALMLVPVMGAAAHAADPAETNVVDRIECMFRVYVTEGGEQGLDCLA